MNPTAQARQQALAQFEATWDAMLAAADKLRTALLDDAGMDGTHPRVLRIMEVVAKDFDLPISVMASRVRIDEYVVPRHIAIVLCMRLTTLSSVQLGRAFHRDHGAILHAKNALAARMMDSNSLSARFARLEIAAREALKVSA